MGIETVMKQGETALLYTLKRTFTIRHRLRPAMVEIIKALLEAGACWDSKCAEVLRKNQATKSGHACREILENYYRSDYVALFRKKFKKIGVPPIDFKGWLMHLDPDQLKDWQPAPSASGTSLSSTREPRYGGTHKR